MIWIFVVIILVLLVWGLIGSSKAAEVGTSCDIGIGKDGRTLCWKWHQNVAGDVADIVNKIFK